MADLLLSLSSHMLLAGLVALLSVVEATGLLLLPRGSSVGFSERSRIALAAQPQLEVARADKDDKIKRRPPVVRVRVDRLLLMSSLVDSREEALELIAEGRVADCNGELITRATARVDANDSPLLVDERPLPPLPAPVYVLLNKPINVITTMTTDPSASRRRRGLSMPTVMDTVRAFETQLNGNTPLPRIFPVGRLDADSEGLLLLTNDGALCSLLCDPAHRISKTYLVKVVARSTQGQQRPQPLGAAHPEPWAKLTEGVTMRDGEYAQAVEARPIRSRQELEGHTGMYGELFDGSSHSSGNDASSSSSYRGPPPLVGLIVMQEGKRREVRRMLDAVGFRTERLIRVRIGGLQDDSLPSGACRHLTPEEVEGLKGVMREGSGAGYGSKSHRIDSFYDGKRWHSLFAVD